MFFPGEASQSPEIVTDSELTSEKEQAEDQLQTHQKAQSLSGGQTSRP